MPLQKVVHAIYGTALTVYFSLEDPAATGSDKFVTGTIAGLPIVAGDVKISKDGGAAANASNLPTQVTVFQPFYALALTATEMQADHIAVVLQDGTTPAAWRSLRIDIYTKLQLGQLVCDANNYSTNATAFYARGKGGGYGIQAIAGASGRITNLFDTVLGTEPTAVYNPTTSTIQQALQLVAGRLYLKAAASGSSLQLYKADGVTVLATATISVSGGVVTRGKFA